MYALFPSPLGIFFVSMKIMKMFRLILILVSVPFGELFYFYANQGVTQSSGNTFPSPLGSFFISTLSYGNLSGHRENLHFAVQKVFSGKIRGFEACKLL